MSAADASTHTRRRVRAGIGMMCLAVAVLPFLNLDAKWLAGHGYPVMQIAWARYAGHLAYLLLVFLPLRGPRLFATRQPGIHLLRSALLLVATLCYFTALGYISLPMAASIGFTSPLIVTLLAIPMLGEQVGIRRFAAVGVGFAGALIVVRPGLGGVHWAALLVFVTASCYGIYQVLTRRAGALDNPVTSVTYTAVVGTLVLSAGLPWFWVTPTSLAHASGFALIGGFACLGHYFIVRAITLAPASIMAPFNYGQLIGAIALGYLVFGTLPDGWTWLGATLIVASGLYVAYRETIRR